MHPFDEARLSHDREIFFRRRAHLWSVCRYDLPMSPDALLSLISTERASAILRTDDQMRARKALSLIHI